MRNILKKLKRTAILFAGLSALLLSCSKKEVLVDAPYSSQSIGLAPAAIATVGPGANGIYTVTPKIEGRDYRFVTDVATNKLTLELGIIRSGVDLSGSVSVSIAAINDTIAKLITAGKLAAGTQILPATAYTLPTDVTIEDGSDNKTFLMPIDLNFMVANMATKYAVALSIASPKTDIINNKLSVAVIFIDPAQVLLPVANFSNSIDKLSKTSDFINISANSTNYSWDYGDGSPVETRASPSHQYGAAGTYVVTLTASGVTGTPSIKMVSIVIL